jgi:serine/threonine protein kinase
MECPYCNYENRDGVRYCIKCGNAISPATTISLPAHGTSGSLAIGTPLQGGRYVITRVLGEGGMGTALLATDKRIDNKLVVIKELFSDNTDPAKFQEDVRNFKREVATLAHLDHPLISYVTDNFDEDSRYFMVQKYIEGENLEERMDRLNQPMKEGEVLGWASEVLDILDYLEQQTLPIVHRDIKPANIIIGSKDRRAHLVDFGIARADEARNIKRKQTSALGTPGYAPPEQYQGNADPRSDLYALGATMHHLLTNQDPRNHPPFSYPPLRTLNPRVSPETQRLLTKTVNNDITQRYQSARAMKRDVDDILLKRFGVSGNGGSYSLGTSGPMAAAGGVSAAAYANQPMEVQQPPITPLPASSLHPSPGWLEYLPRREIARSRENNASLLSLSRGKTVLLAGTVLLLLIASGIGLFAFTHANQAATSNTIPYSPYKGTPVLNDPLRDNSQGFNWLVTSDSSGSCAFTGGAYHARTGAGYYYPCIANATDFDNFAYEVQMKIIKGDCGAILFRVDSANTSFYYFRVCQDGSYALYRYTNYAGSNLIAPQSNSVINAGLNQSNLVAVVAQGSTLDLYVNQQKVDSISDNTYSHGKIGIVADGFPGSHPTEVAYSNAKVWKL